MQITCLKENLKQALNITERIIGRNLTLPILNNILLTAENNLLKVASTNLEIGINYWVIGKIEKEGSITVPAKLLSSFIGSLPNKKIEIKTKDNQLYLKCENFKAVIKGLDAKDFPIIPKIKDRPLIKIKGNIIKTALSQVVEMASTSESRPEISGIFLKFEKKLIKLAATDSFRLAEKNIHQAQEEINSQFIIVPQRTIQELIRILGENQLAVESSSSNKEEELEIILGGNQVLFNLKTSQIISRLIDGQYPDYQQIIPKNFQTQVIINRNELIGNIKTASLFSGKINEIKMFIHSPRSNIEILAKDIDIGENKSQIEAKIEGKSVEATFNYKYVLDGLNNIFSDKVILGFNDSQNPVVIRPVGDMSYTYLVMPIKPQ